MLILVKPKFFSLGRYGGFYQDRFLLSEGDTMKIVIINQHIEDAIGGSEIQCDIIATHLARFGHKIFYLAVRGKKESYETRYKVMPLKKLNPFKLYRILQKIKPDVVYWRCGRKALLFSAIVSKLNGSKFIYSISHIRDSKVWIRKGHFIFLNYFDKKQKLVGIIANFCSLLFILTPLRSAFNFCAVPLFVDGVVSLNSDFLKNMPVKKKVTIHNSMSSKTLNFTWPKPYIVWIANLKKAKNPEKYYYLSKQLEDTGIDFLMIGSIQEKSYKFILDIKEKSQNFYYLGPKTPIEVNGILNKALFMVHTCDPEGFGNNFIQAWLQGKPTISLYFDPEGIIEREGIGFFSRTFTRFVEHTRQLIENNDMRVKMGNRALKFATKQFNSEKNVRKLENFLKDIIMKRV